jgi:hypothetical protein
MSLKKIFKFSLDKPDMCDIFPARVEGIVTFERKINFVNDCVNWLLISKSHK